MTSHVKQKIRIEDRDRHKDLIGSGVPWKLRTRKQNTLNKNIGKVHFTARDNNDRRRKGDSHEKKGQGQKTLRGKMKKERENVF